MMSNNENRRMKAVFIRNLIYFLVVWGLWCLPVIVHAADEGSGDTTGKVMEPSAVPTDGNAAGLTTAEAVEQAAERPRKRLSKK